jgi:hypothetical protein
MYPQGINWVLLFEELEVTIEVIRIRRSNMDRQHNDQMKKDNRTKIQSIHIKLKIE